MAIKEILWHGTMTPPKRYQGVSSDVKPDAVEGSTFHVVDTGEEYVRYDGAWELDLRIPTALNRAMEV